jgi:hypothetical protein
MQLRQGWWGWHVSDVSNVGGFLGIGQKSVLTPVLSLYFCMAGAAYGIKIP